MFQIGQSGSDAKGRILRVNGTSSKLQQLRHFARPPPKPDLSRTSPQWPPDDHLVGVQWTRAVYWRPLQSMTTEHAGSVLIPLIVLAVLWTVVRHWILPFVLGFALAVALGPSARPMMASAWATVANVGEAMFGPRSDMAEPRPWSPDRRRPGPGGYDDE